MRALKNVKPTTAVKVYLGVNQKGICKFHSSSPYSNHFNGEIIKNHSWRLFIPEPVSTLTWKTAAKFSTFSGHFQGKYSYELWNSPLDFVNNTHCCFMSKAERCNNHYVHKGKDFLMELNKTTKVKISLYKNDAEAAFVIFEKKVNTKRQLVSNLKSD